MLIYRSIPLNYHALFIASSRPIDFDVIRPCLEYLDFADDPVTLDEIGLAWWFFIWSTRFESDEMYTIVKSNEGEKIYPRKDSTCQLLLDAFGSDIRDNLTDFKIERIWVYARSLLFLKWFMNSTHSEALTIRRDTGWSPIWALLNFSYGFTILNHQAQYDLTKQKIKFLIERGASLHYSKYGETLTTSAMKNAEMFYLWREVLQELEIDIPIFLEEEAEQISLQNRGWSPKHIVALFQASTFSKSERSRFEWDEYHRCLRCGSRIKTFWQFYLEYFQRKYSGLGGRTNDKLGDHGRVENADQIDIDEAGDNDEVYQDDEVNDGDEIDDDDETKNDDEVDDGDEINDEDETKNDDEVDNDNEADSDDEFDDKEDFEDDEIGDDDKASDEERGDNDELTWVDEPYEDYMTYLREPCMSCDEALRLMQSFKPSMPGSFDES